MQPVEHQVASDARLRLWPQRAADDPDRGLLFVADAHIGKAVSFRRWGVPVPEATTAETLGRLDVLLRHSGAREVVFLGDLLHSARSHAAATLDAFAAWRGRHPDLRLTLVIGNHDRRAGRPPSTWGVDVVEGPLRRGPWALDHEPGEVDDAYLLAGHIHPGVQVGGGLTLPCFHFGPRCGLLPAFGDFTGLHRLPRAAAAERRYAIADDLVAALPTLAG